MSSKRYSFVPPGGGPSYDWTRDHTFVKISAADSGGAFTLMEDNLKREFALGLHMHKRHAESFRMLMIYQPSGFDQYLAELAALTPQQLEDEALTKRLDEKYDIVNLGPV